MDMTGKLLKSDSLKGSAAAQRVKTQISIITILKEGKAKTGV